MTGTYFPSSWIEETLGNVPSELTITTRCSGAEVVPFRSEAYRFSSFMKSSSRSQFKKASVLSEGGEEGFENRAERRWDILVPQSTARISRAGKRD